MTIERDWVAAGSLSVVCTHRRSDFGTDLAVLQRGDDFAVSDVSDVSADQRTAHPPRTTRQFRKRRPPGARIWRKGCT